MAIYKKDVILFFAFFKITNKEYLKMWYNNKCFTT